MTLTRVNKDSDP